LAPFIIELSITSYTVKRHIGTPFSRASPDAHDAVPDPPCPPPWLAALPAPVRKVVNVRETAELVNVTCDRRANAVRSQRYRRSPRVPQPHSALTRWASSTSSCADHRTRRRLSWPSCHACRAIVCRLSCTCTVRVRIVDSGIPGWT
jgi:hypothetical protein